MRENLKTLELGFLNVSEYAQVAKIGNGLWEIARCIKS